MKHRVGLAAAGLLAAGCVAGVSLGIPGNGVIQTQTREVSGFSQVEIHGVIHAKVAVGPAGPLVIKGDENLLPLIKTEVRDGRLVVTVDAPEGIRPTQPITLDIITPTLDSVVAHDASRVEATVAEAPKLSLEAHGASMLTATGLDSPSVVLKGTGTAHAQVVGKAARIALDLSGASRAELAKLAATNAEVQISGASRADLQVEDLIKGQVSGASNLRVQGTVSQREVQKSGASRIVYPPQE